MILLLSVKAGLRAKEIASLTWDMATTSDGEVGTAIHLTNEASKGRGGGRVDDDVSGGWIGQERVDDAG